MPLHELRLHQLEGFYQVGRHQGFTRAAQALPYPITESALHQQVRRLEATLGVALLEREVASMVEGLRRGELDLGLAAVTDPPEGCDFAELGRLGLSLLVGPGHPLARRRAPPRLAQLDGLALVHYEAGSPARSYAERALAAAGLSHTATAQVSGSAAMRALVGAGLGAAFVPAVGKRRPRRSVSRDGVVSFDVTHLLREVSPLPRYGWLTRQGQALAGLAARFAALVASL